MLKIKSILHERINESRKIAPVSEFQWWSCRKESTMVIASSKYVNQYNV